ncbi:MAG TPA: c-type cytochrome [Polyangiaceae bacterium]|nr:c-type cytochrome [Polyangiaceae bacterium]
MLAVGLLLSSFFGWLLFVQRSGRVYALSPTSPAIDRTPTTLARGEHLARGLAGCAECHGADFGGRVFAETPLFRAVAPNLTRGKGGAIRGYSERDWWNAIVHGVRPSGRSLLLMPSKELASFDDRDVSAMIAFLQTLPAVDRMPGVSQVTPLGEIVIGLLGLPTFSAEVIDHGARRPSAPELSPTREYGGYLLNVCRGCHGPDLRGGIVIHPGSPPSADISPAVVSQWEFRTLERALREGIGRDGRVLDSAMPWRSMKNLSNDELRAIWLGLRQE